MTFVNAGPSDANGKSAACVPNASRARSFAKKARRYGKNGCSAARFWPGNSVPWPSGCWRWNNTGNNGFPVRPTRRRPRSDWNGFAAVGLPWPLRQTQSARLEERNRQLHQDTEVLTAQEAELVARQAAWVHHHVQDQAEQEKLRQELSSLRMQRHSFEQQLETLRDEVERLARLLLDGNDPAPLPISQAA